MINAAIYCRISADREGEGLGVERQEADCRALAEKLGLRVAQVFTDNDISASTRSKKPRPGYDQMIAAAEAGRISAIVAYSNSRLTRRPRELEGLVELHQRTGVRIHTVVSGQYDLSTADGRLHARLLGSIDAAEAERTAERVSRAARQAAEAGKWHGGPRPFGYEDDGVMVREAEAEALREGYRQVLAGASLASIARSWNAQGLRTGAHSQQWKTPSVREVLCSSRYAGLRSYRGEILGPAEWDAIVDRETWEATVTILRDPARRHGPISARRLLTGLAVCAICGETAWASGGTATRPSYRCRTGGHFARKAEPIDDYVTGVIIGRLSMPDAAVLFQEKPKEDTEQGDLRDQAQALRARLDSLAVDFADGAITSEQLRTATARLRERLDGIESKLSVSLQVSPLTQFAGRDPEQVWRSLDVDVQRAVIDQLAEVKIHPTLRGSHAFKPESVEINWR